jgi:hypothetical protein
MNPEELQISPSGWPIVPSDLLDHPSDSPSNTYRPVKCSNLACEFLGEADVKFGQPPTGTCPDCGDPIGLDFSRMTWGIGSRGPGFHSTKFGQRRKHSMIARSEKLAKSQWDNHAPQGNINPHAVRNPTEGGVYDPNSKFNKHKKKPGSTTTIH